MATLLVENRHPTHPAVCRCNLRFPRAPCMCLRSSGSRNTAITNIGYSAIYATPERYQINPISPSTACLLLLPQIKCDRNDPCGNCIDSKAKCLRTRPKRVGRPRQSAAGGGYVRSSLVSLSYFYHCDEPPDMSVDPPQRWQNRVDDQPTFSSGKLSHSTGNDSVPWKNSSSG